MKKKNLLKEKFNHAPHKHTNNNKKTLYSLCLLTHGERATTHAYRHFTEQAK